MLNANRSSPSGNLANAAPDAAANLFPVSSVRLNPANPSFTTRLTSVAKAIKSNILPTAMGAGTSYASAGSALFGARLFFGYSVDYFYQESTAPQWTDDVKLAISLLGIGMNVVTVLNTRWPATFRGYRELFNKPAKTPAPVEITADLEFTPSPSPVSHIIEIEDEDEKHTPVETTPVSSPASSDGKIDIPEASLAQILSNEPIFSPANSQQSTDANLEEKSEADAPCWSFTRKTIYYSAFSFGFGSLAYASLNRFLSGVTLNEFIAGLVGSKLTPTTLNVMYGAAAFAVVCRFATGYAFSIPLTRKTAYKFSRWLTTDEPIDRWADVKSYMPALGLSGLNIAANAFIAHYSTTQTLIKIPYICDYDSAIKAIAIAGTVTSIANSMLSQLPTVRRNYENWRYKTPDKSKEIQALNKLDFPAFSIYSSFIYSCGMGDAIMQGATAAVSVIDTCNDKFDIDKYNPYLFAFAMACWLSFTIVEYSSSTCRGWRDTKINEVYDCFMKRGLLPISEDNEVLAIDELIGEDEAQEQRTTQLVAPLLTPAERAEAQESDVKSQSPVSTPAVRANTPLARHSLFVSTSRSTPTGSPILTSRQPSPTTSHSSQPRSPILTSGTFSPKRSPVPQSAKELETERRDHSASTTVGESLSFEL